MSDANLVRVRDVMKNKFDFVDGMTTIKDALDAMEHVDTRCLIVRKRDENDEIGILLISDIARMVVAKGRAPERVNVYEVMQKPVISVDPDMDIRYCARLFDQCNLARTPVVRAGEVVGIVSYSDLVIKGLAKKRVGAD
jgi:signal-transduction protein with cAMP-binding, CBS, and nucleotidyltransferase domain